VHKGETAQANVFPIFRVNEQEIPSQPRGFQGFVSFDFDFALGFICYVILPACNGCVVPMVIGSACHAPETISRIRQKMWCGISFLVYE